MDVSLASAPSSATPAGSRALAAETRSIRTYDFRRPDKFSKDQLRTLQAVHENFARVAAAQLSARLRTHVVITFEAAEQMMFEEYVGALTLPTQLAVLRTPALDGPFLAEIDLALGFAWVERAMGSPGITHTSRREPTSIEAVLIEQLVDELRPAFTQGWAHVVDFPVTVSEIALGPALLRVAAATQVVAVMTFNVRLGTLQSRLTVCYPHEVFAPVLQRLSATAWYPATDPTADGQDGLRRTLESVDVEATAILGRVELSVDALSTLRVGDIIRLDEPANEPILLEIGEDVRAWGVPGRIGDRLALRLVTPLASTEA
jgi:flagellar motor switch protein FliM